MLARAAGHHGVVHQSLHLLYICTAAVALQVAYAVLTFYFLMPFVFMSIFTSDKRFFAADTAARLYHPAQYYLSKVTITLPFNIIVAIVFHLVYYGMAGMRHSAVAMAASGLICVLTGLIGMQVRRRCWDADYHVLLWTVIRLYSRCLTAVKV
jgi:hypothetical protein